VRTIAVRPAVRPRLNAIVTRIRAHEARPYKNRARLTLRSALGKRRALQETWAGMKPAPTKSAGLPR